MSTFDESQHARDNAGKFTEMAGSEQTDILTAANPPGGFSSVQELIDRDHKRRTAEGLGAWRKQAAGIRAAAQDAYFQTSMAAAIATLQDQFPWARTAVFTRGWDEPEDRIVLAQLLSADRDFDMEEDGEQLSTDQMISAGNVSAWVSEFAGNVTRYLEVGENEHDGWYEYTLDLTEKPSERNPLAAMADAMTERDRDELTMRMDQAAGFSSGLGHNLHDALLDRQDGGPHDAELARAAAWVRANEDDALWGLYLGPLVDRIQRDGGAE